MNVLQINKTSMFSKSMASNWRYK